MFPAQRGQVCAECGLKLDDGELFRLEDKRLLCLRCADLDHLVYLPRGNTALTRRAGRHSTLRAVVLRFSRARRRFERQGILVEQAALERAERECLADAVARERARERAALLRADHDNAYIRTFAERLGDRFPHSPADERQAIAEHACRKHSGRVGRSAAAKEFNAAALELAVRAHVRHRHTRYDQLLARGLARAAARSRVRNQVKAVIQRWTGAGNGEPQAG